MNTDISVNSHKLNKIRRDAIEAGRSHICRTLSKPELEIQREIFDPTNAAHLEHYRHFKMTGKWPGAKSFKTEWPYVSVPAAVEAKIINHVLNIK